MNTPSTSTDKTTRRLSRVLALLSTTALGLAASPTALAFDERGGPGTPSAQQVNASVFFPVSKLPQRLVSWSD